MRFKFVIFIVIAVAAAVYFMTGIYQVDPSQVALVKTFGKYS